MRFRNVSLDDEAWAQLDADFAAVSTPSPGRALLHYLRFRAKARTMLIEEEYVDRDHRASAACLYVQQFASTPRLCTRYHFFAEVTSWRAIPGEAAPPNGSYIGYVVRRPVEEAPIGIAVLALNPAWAPRAFLACQATFRANVSETTLEVNGVPYCEQDGTIMTCAETSIWIASRIMMKNFEHSLLLAPHVATRQTVGMSTLGRPLPSPGLTVDQMTNVLTSHGFGTLVYDASSAKPNTWNVISTVAPYLASGIPVVLTGKQHAITACGGVLRKNRSDCQRMDNLTPTYEWIEALIVQDDARGPYRLMARDDAAYRRLEDEGYSDLLIDEGVADWWRTISDIESLLVPLPSKVFLTATDVVNLIKQYITPSGLSPELRDRLEQLPADLASANRLLEASRGVHGGIVFSLRCRRSVEVRKELASLLRADGVARRLLHETPLPRLLWAVELTTFEDFASTENTPAKVLGELYFDATARAKSDSQLLFLNLPGLVQSRPDVSRAAGSSRIESHLDLLWESPTRQTIPFWTASHLSSL